MHMTELLVDRVVPFFRFLATLLHSVRNGVRWRERRSLRPREVRAGNWGPIHVGLYRSTAGWASRLCVWELGVLH